MKVLYNSLLIEQIVFELHNFFLNKEVIFFYINNYFLKEILHFYQLLFIFIHYYNNLYENRR